jgi:hypothetical protein
VRFEEIFARFIRIINAAGELVAVTAGSPLSDSSPLGTPLNAEMRSFHRASIMYFFL